MSLSEKVLLFLSKKPDAADYTEGRNEWTSEGALAMLCSIFPDFLERVRSMDVLDYGCGTGYQTVAIVNNGAHYVLGIDPSRKALAEAQRLAAETNTLDRVKFAEQFSTSCKGRFDLVISQNSMEHYSDPVSTLEEMKSALKPDGQIFLTFGPLWFAPYGSHMQFFAKVPWVNLIFSERVVMNVRKNFRQDGATRYEDVESGLNRMTVAKFESIVTRIGLKVLYRRYDCVKNIQVLGHIPVLRELFINRISCVLTRA